MISHLAKINKFLPLLTDTVPYEVPILFSNRGFYETIKTAYDKHYREIMRKKAQGNSIDTALTIKNFLKNNFFINIKDNTFKSKMINLLDKPLIPYEYFIIKNQEHRRKISLIHPISQILICDFYAKYENEILFSTTRNAVSLRYPVKVASRVFKQHTSLINKFTKEEKQINCEDPREVLEDKEKFEINDIPNNFFIYKKYRLLYKFYESKEFLDLEQRFDYCRQFDIQRCFESIYTHAITWAIKGKNSAKLFKMTSSFENDIDKIMQNSNWAETHGIPIGSEFSRIYAEIILQKIDDNVENSIDNEKSLRNGVDFKIRRYIDDFFIFVNSIEVGDKIFNLYEEELSNFKLFVNHNKIKILYRPFITTITSAKQQLAPLLHKVLRSYHYTEIQDGKLSSDNIFSKANQSYGLIKSLIEEIRVTIFDKKISMIDISNLLLSKIKSELLKILNIILAMPNDKKENIFTGANKYFNDVLELSFYIFNLSSRANTSYGIHKICFIILEILEHIDNPKILDAVKHKIYSNFLLFFENKKKTNLPLSEFLDIIWIFENLGSRYSISEERLKKIFNLDNEMSYFEIMIVLYYIRDKAEFQTLKISVLENILKKFQKFDDIFIYAEMFMLFFDTIKCPYIPEKFKKKILGIVKFTTNKKETIDFIAEKKWFFGWDEKLSLKKLLEIKELHNAY